ncbi:hypothetical protein DPMN_108294 [Dreissena polymorpha]|uniref:Uncharacterized protein n=1 Tax=Dreissena polymorpha TaxID=45954 RepID=A0A9D4QKU1_DREPO|nr:hypothetical protein DPMN_108294 [Dreissena polymorpha]
MLRKKRSKGFCTQKYLWKKPKVTTSTDETIPAPTDETIPALSDETIPALSDEIKPALSDETIPALSGLSNDSCSGNSPTCRRSNVYVQTCDEGNDYDYCVRLDDDSGLLNTGFIDNGPDIMNMEDETDILNRGFLEDFEQNANGRTTLNHQECDIEDCVDFLKLQTEVQENIRISWFVKTEAN